MKAQQAKVDQAAALFERHFSSTPSATTKKTIAVAPGRVNLIGEHTDYTGGFVLPFAIDYSCLVYGHGTLKEGCGDNDEKKVTVRCVSAISPEAKVEEFVVTSKSKPPTSNAVSWTDYIAGTIYQYLPDLPDSTPHMELTFTVASDVPLGSGLSSSASLEVSVARFIEAILGDSAFSSIRGDEEDSDINTAKVRALRCQKAENDFCHSPCGIMDQYISSAASEGSLLLIDCTSYEATKVNMKDTTDRPVLVVTNSNVKHSIGGGEYPVRVKQCQQATKVLHGENKSIHSLREATLNDVEAARDRMDSTTTYQRAKHVVTENARVLEATKALEAGDWKTVGQLMNGSHASMRDDYEVSCHEIDLLVDIAQSYPGVYGSRLTGGGFGGCTVTLVEPDAAEGLQQRLQQEFKAKTGKECECFQTLPARGAHLLEL
eukprot:scaffold1028_cov135-Cylindrotheca_fusiformis.AAC.7